MDTLKTGVGVYLYFKVQKRVPDTGRSVENPLVPIGTLSRSVSGNGSGCR